MNLNLFKGYVLVVLSGLVILAAAILVALQWGNRGDFSLYGKNIPDASTAVVVLTSAAGGVVLLYLAKVMARGISALRKGRREQRQRAAEQGTGGLKRPRAPAEK